MRSQFANLRVLVLPGGATTGPRIVLDGINGQELIYNLLGQLYGSITPAEGFKVVDPADTDNYVAINILSGFPALRLHSSDSAEIGFSGVFTTLIGAGGTRQIADAIGLDGFNNGCSLVIYSASFDDTLPARVAQQLGNDFGNYIYAIPAGQVSIAKQQNNDLLVAGTEKVVDTCTINDQVVLNKRKYRIEGEASFSNVTTRVLLRLRYTTDGSVPGTGSTLLKASTLNTVAAGTTGGTGRVVEPEYIPGSNLGLSVCLTAQADNAIGVLGPTSNQEGFVSITDGGST